MSISAIEFASVALNSASHKRSLVKRSASHFNKFKNYETGANRVSAARLYEICQTLNVSISEMFEAFAPPAAAVRDVVQALPGRV